MKNSNDTIWNRTSGHCATAVPTTTTTTTTTNNNNNNNNVIKKEAEKILKYKDLTIEIQRMWKVKTRIRYDMIYLSTVIG